jgi:prepilin-type N-terminal cleavage/methylation domain-containing protein
LFTGNPRPSLILEEAVGCRVKTGFADLFRICEETSQIPSFLRKDPINVVGERIVRTEDRSMERLYSRNRRGFTLVEIMIVVLIIGILLAIAVPNFIRARESARAKSCVANLKSINGAKEQWAMANKKTSADTPTVDDLYGVDKYIKSTPSCPSGGSYTLAAVSTVPTCSVGTNGAGDASDDHVLP